jgi:hypothetical protein
VSASAHFAVAARMTVQRENGSLASFIHHRQNVRCLFATIAVSIPCFKGKRPPHGPETTHEDDELGPCEHGRQQRRCHRHARKQRTAATTRRHGSSGTKSRAALFAWGLGTVALDIIQSWAGRPGHYYSVHSWELRLLMLTRVDRLVTAHSKHTQVPTSWLKKKNGTTKM